MIYVIAMIGETNRAPFDLPEAEGELVGGFHTEYSSLKFALFFLAEYINMATVSALATTLFLGGWRAPFSIDEIWAGANEGYWPFLWFMGKVLFFIFIFIWLRGSLPRLRYDQFMALRLEGPDPGLAASGSWPSPPSASSTCAAASTGPGSSAPRPCSPSLSDRCCSSSTRRRPGPGHRRRGRGALRRVRRRLPRPADAGAAATDAETPREGSADGAR